MTIVSPQGVRESCRLFLPVQKEGSGSCGKEAIGIKIPSTLKIPLARYLTRGIMSLA